MYADACLAQLCKWPSHLAVSGHRHNRTAALQLVRPRQTGQDWMKTLYALDTAV